MIHYEIYEFTDRIIIYQWIMKEGSSIRTELVTLDSKRCRVTISRDGLRYNVFEYNCLEPVIVFPAGLTLYSNYR